MVEHAAVGVRRAFVEDARRDGKFMRLTWHGDRQQFVVSNWDGNTCIGATRVPVSDAPALIGVLTAGLADAAGRPPVPVAARPRTLREHLRSWWQDRTGDAPARPEAPSPTRSLVA